MSKIKTISPDEAKDELKDIYQNLEKKMGKVINIFQNMGNPPLVLKAFIQLNEAASQTSLDPSLREQIALIVGQTNQCNYCLSAHSFIAKGLGMSESEILNARRGVNQNLKNEAILKFVKEVVEKRAQVSNQDLASLKDAGVTDKELVEIILLINVNMFTNYFNLITDPKIDFPLAPEL